MYYNLIWSSNYYVLVYWLPTYWEICEMQYSWVTNRFGDTIRSTPFKLRIQWFSMPLLMPHGMCRIYASCSVVLSLLVSSVVGVSDITATKMLIVERWMHLWDVVAVGRESAMLLRQTLLWCWSFDPDCWFIIELIIWYILHSYLILSSLSQVIRIIYRCVCLVMCIW